MRAAAMGLPAAWEAEAREMPPAPACGPGAVEAAAARLAAIGTLQRCAEELRAALLVIDGEEGAT